MMEYCYALAGQKCVVEDYTTRNNEVWVVVKPVNYRPCFEGDNGRHLVPASDVRFYYL